MGWYVNTKKNLNDRQLIGDFDQIRNLRPIEWKIMVKEAVEKKNKNTLIDDCYKKQDGEKSIKTKTAKIVEEVESSTYRRGPRK